MRSQIAAAAVVAATVTALQSIAAVAKYKTQLLMKSSIINPPLPADLFDTILHIV